MESKLRLIPTTIAEKWRRFTDSDGERRIQLANGLARRLIYRALGFSMSFLFHLISLGRPVRIGTLNAKGKISIMISYIEPYMRQLQLDGGRKPLVVVINPGQCPNEQLSRMYGRAVWLLDDRRPWLRKLFTVIFHILSAAGSPMAACLYSGHTYEFHRAWQEGEPALRFSAEERRKGEHVLANLGIPQGAPYVCFGLREAAYYQEFLTPEAQVLYTNPEDREDTYIRNPPLKNYIPMALQCSNLGLYILRMGKAVDESLPPDLHQKIIDYASKHWTPFGDVYLLANCKFVVAGAAGFWWIASAFNRPVVMTDTYLLWGTLRADDLFIPKKLWLISEKRLLTFREMLAVGPLYMYQANCLRDGIELVHNTPDEISAVVLEMEQRLNGAWKSSEEDEELQHRFKSLYPPRVSLRVDERHDFFKPNVRIPGRIGAEFLRQYVHLLN